MKTTNIDVKITNLATRNVKDHYYREFDTKIDKNFIRETGVGRYLYKQREMGTHIIFEDRINENPELGISFLQAHINSPLYLITVTEFRYGAPYGTVKKLNDRDAILKKIKKFSHPS